MAQAYPCSENTVVNEMQAELVMPPLFPLPTRPKSSLTSAKGKLSLLIGKQQHLATCFILNVHGYGA